jgi:hypothetical protein
MAKKTKKKTKKTARKYAKKKRPDVASYHLRLNPEHVEWLDEQAEFLEVSRSYFLDRLIGSIAETERFHSQSGRGSLFDEFADRLTSIIEERVRKTMCE